MSDIVNSIDTESHIDCFCCGKQMGNWTYQTRRKDGTSSYVTVHPMGGLHFQTYGHYGSRVFDPMDGKDTRLDIAICDECVIANVKRVHGTGFDHVHEIALQENEQYADEKRQENETLLQLFEESMKELGDD